MSFAIIIESDDCHVKPVHSAGSNWVVGITKHGDEVFYKKYVEDVQNIYVVTDELAAYRLCRAIRSDSGLDDITRLRNELDAAQTALNGRLSAINARLADFAKSVELDHKESTCA